MSIKYYSYYFTISIKAQEQQNNLQYSTIHHIVPTRCKEKAFLMS